MRRLLVIAMLTEILPILPAQAEELLIIANPSVSAATPLTFKQIEEIYLLRITVWPDGSHIVPVNREINSEIRMEFTSTVLKQDNPSLAAYWNQMHFQGKLPPLVQESELAVLAFVRSVPGAIGYISASTPPTGVKVVGRVP